MIVDEQVFRNVEDIIRDVIGVEKITMDTEFVRDLALNSMDLANLVCEFENRFQIEVNLREVKNMMQIKDVVEYIIENKLIEEEQP